MLNVNPYSLRQIAVSYLGIPEGRVATFEASAGKDTDLFKFKIIEYWRNRNPGPNARSELHALLMKGAADGLINSSVFSSLLTTPKKGNLKKK